MLQCSGLPSEIIEKLNERVHIEHCLMENLKHREADGYFVCNPPYGERLGDMEQAKQTYRSMGHLLREFPDWNLMTITTDPDFEEALACRAQSRRPIRNGNSEAFIYFHSPRPDRGVGRG